MKPSFRATLYIILFLALFATLGSLYMSEVLDWPPCVLCWQQRIFMYPIPILVIVGLLTRDNNVFWYVLPMSLIGFGIATYHELLYAGVIPEAFAPCIKGISCTTKYPLGLGFISIPLLSAGVFACIAALSIWNIKKGRHAQ